ncbi:hypothetical protein QM806_27510 [Rhodococcus sp. IEGM 1351]|uniref:hypothetical protein n=1 Tax=Rhodococcus sp. IEGM 1351 TaxID=3047089 RepID=UPI0024B6E2DA|nr:hypothetical protein [Rhodococcus sp. IEGM 1351]MDI9939140.1 hypothetical protein [Rhodococcus sp. IEGM 1351]
MAHLTVPQQALLREGQDCATALRRWLAIDSNSAALMAYLRGEPVDRTWLATYQRLHRGTRPVRRRRRPAAPAYRHQRGGGPRTAFEGGRDCAAGADTGSR